MFDQFLPFSALFGHLQREIGILCTKWPKNGKNPENWSKCVFLRIRKCEPKSACLAIVAFIWRPEASLFQSIQTIFSEYEVYVQITIQIDM